MTLWSGFYLISVEKGRWYSHVEVAANTHTDAIEKNWYHAQSALKSIRQLVMVSSGLSAAEFTVASLQLQLEYPFVKYVFHVPLVGKRMPLLTYPENIPEAKKRALVKHIKAHKGSFKKGLYLLLAPDKSQNSLVVFPYVKDRSSGVVVMQINFEEMIQQSLPELRKKGVGIGLLFNISTLNGTLLFEKNIFSLLPVENLSETLVRRYTWGNTIWTFNWQFSDVFAGGARLLFSFVVFIIGFITTGVLGWFVLAQQGLAGRVRQQVVDRTNQLEQASRRFKLITDNAYDLITIISDQGLIDYANSAYRSVLGYKPQDMIGKTLESYVHPKDVAVFHRALQDVVEGKNAMELMFRMRHKDGHWLHMEAVAKGLHDSQWTVSNVVLHCRDITSRKQFADDLARSEQRFRDFAGSSADWLWEVNEKLKFTYVSPGVANVLGFQPEEMMGFMQFDALFDDDNDPTRELIESRVQRHQPYREIEFWTRSKNGERICLRISGVPVFDDLQQFCGYRGAASNITASKIDRDKMFKMATTDHLTGLLNRNRFMEELERSVSLAKRHNTKGVLLFIDLDRFKEINDTHGHEAGDEILRGVSDILRQSVRSTDIVARLGGDEFAVIMHNISYKRAQAKMQKVIDKINVFSVDYRGAKLNATMSIGMVVYPQEDKDSDSLIMSADLAMYRAKDMGRNRLYVDEADSSEETQHSVRAQLKWVERLRTCLETGDFEMHFQAIVPTKKRQRPLFEALLRIYDEDGQVGSPAIYIDAAEHFGLIQQLDLSVIERCISTQAELMANGVNVDISVNLSSRTLGDPEVTERLRALVKQFDIEPARITFEVTETIALHDPSAMRDLAEIHIFITELRRMGFRFAIDDFGSGFSSFSYLRVLQVDVIKIDGAFVKDLETSKTDYFFVKSIVDLAKGLGIQTIAEFVEDEKILQILLDLGVDYGQGYHIAKPGSDIVALEKVFVGKTMDDFNMPNPKITLPPMGPRQKPKLNGQALSQKSMKKAPVKKLAAKKKILKKKPAKKSIKKRA